MAAGALGYSANGDLEADLTKFGFLVYGGTVRDFHEWEFRAMVRFNQTKDEEKPALASKFLDSLRTDAYVIAEDLGPEILGSKDNIPSVIEAVRKHIFPLTEQESKELYRLGTQTGGLLSRQAGEPMVSYIARRKRWWKKLQQIDKGVVISEPILTDLLLDNSGLSRQERLMVLTAMGSSTKLEDACSALVKMHSKIHTLEKKQGGSYHSGSGKGKGYSAGKHAYGSWNKGKGKVKGKGKSKTPSGASYLASVDEIFDDHDGFAFASAEDQEEYYGNDEDCEYSQDSEEWHHDVDMIAYSAEAPTRDVELDVFSAFLCAGDFDPDSSEHVAFMSDVVQAETMAYMARSKAKGKGKPLSKDAHGYRPRASGLTVEDRRAKLKEIKMKSTCKACGRKGHWAGDRECPGKPPAGHRAVSQVAHLAGEIRTFEKAVQTDDPYGTSESETGASRRESWNSDERAAHYVHLSNQDEGHVFMGFFDKADIVSSNEDVPDGTMASRSPPESSWGYVEFPEGHDMVFGFGRHKGQTYWQVLQTNPSYVHWGLAEKDPSPQLKAFLVWVHRNFVITPPGEKIEARDIPLGFEQSQDLEFARAMAICEKKPKSKLSLLPMSPKGPCVGGCPPHALNKAGSNSHIIKTTCMLCGTKTSTRRESPVPQVAYEDCQHLRTDNRGSDRRTHRVYCLDCCRIIDETPQTLHKESLALAQKLAGSPTQQQDLTRRQLQEYTFSQFEAGKVVKTFFKQMDKYLVNKESVTSTELSSFLEDAMDSVVEGRERVPRLAYSEAAQLATAAASSSAALGSGAPRTPPSASAKTGKGKGSPAANMALGKGVTPPDGHMAQFPEASLLLVDPYEDHDNVWVMLDEGCNSTCHGSRWHAHTTKVLSKHGLKMEKLDHLGGQFRGVGAARVLGRWRMPFSIQLRPSELRVHGELESTELDNKEMLMLLSLQAQSQLGLVKDMRQGTASMSDYPTQSLRLSRHKGHGIDPNVHIGLLKEAGTRAQTPLGGWPKEPPYVQDPSRGPGQPRTSCLHDRQPAEKD